MVFPSSFKKIPDPGRNLHISYHTADPYGDLKDFVRIYVRVVGSIWLVYLQFRGTREKLQGGFLDMFTLLFW